MIKFHIVIKKQNGSAPMHIDEDFIVDTITPELFEKGHEQDLEVQTPFLSCLIWGSIAYLVNQTIDVLSVQCTIEFENGFIAEIPRKVIYDIHRIVGA